MLGPEFEEQVDGRFTVTNGIPPVVRNMVQNEQEHKATRVELAKLKSDLGHLASSVLLPSSIVPCSIGQLKELIDTTNHVTTDHHTGSYNRRPGTNAIDVDQSNAKQYTWK